jgi:hypothetical protein
MRFTRRKRSEAEPASAAQGKPAHGPRKGALTAGSADGYQYREDHSWDPDQQQALARRLREISSEAGN